VLQETPEEEFIRLLRESVKFAAFGVIWTFGMLGQPRRAASSSPNVREERPCESLMARE
jgi:hypothetical protein